MPPLLTKSHKSSLPDAPLARSIHPSIHPTSSGPLDFFFFFRTQDSLPPHYLPQSQPRAILLLEGLHFFFFFFFVVAEGIDMWLFTSLCNASAGFFLLTFRCTVELWVIEDRDVKWMEWNYVNARGSCNDAFIPLQMCSESSSGVLPNPANIETSKIRRILKPKAGLLGGPTPRNGLCFLLSDILKNKNN